MDKTPTPHENKYSTAKPPYCIYNIGNNSPVSLRDFISVIEDACGAKANKNLLPMQPGDVPLTYADIDPLTVSFEFKPSTSIVSGINNFVAWYLKTFFKQ